MEFFTTIKSSLESFAGDLQTICTAVAVVSLIVAAIMFFFGGEAVRSAKKHLLWVLVGIGVAAGAFSIVNAVSATFSF